MRKDTLREWLWSLHSRLRLPFWCCDISWNTYPFRVLYLGFWMVAIDRSKRWYTRWPHISLSWNRN
jgi:hypothetical protein